MNTAQQRTRQKIRRTVTGTAERPRLAVHRSLSHIQVQLIDDTTGKTLVAAHSLKMTGSRSKKAAEVAKALAAEAKTKKISKVVFDRAGKRYLGVIKTVADAVRAEGVQI
jgi:large subunit ribosomal protein L18